MINNEETQSTGRYSVGQKIYGISFLYESQSGKNHGYRSPFGYFGYEKPSQIDIIELTITEHHKVSDHFDEQDKKTCDGYKLKDSKDRVWLNQYPRASYGQTTDNGDRTFSLEVSSKEEIDKLFNGTESWEVYSVTSFYKEIVSAFEHLNKPESRAKTDDVIWFDEKLKFLKELKNTIENKVKEFGLKFVEKQFFHGRVTIYELKPI